MRKVIISILFGIQLMAASFSYGGIQFPKGNRVATVKNVLPHLVQVEYKNSKGKTQRRWISSKGFENQKLITGDSKINLHVND